MSTTVADGGPYLLGLDAGNTVIKAVLFDVRGRHVAAHAIDGATRKPAAGMVERPIGGLWEDAREAIAGCIARAAIDPRSIVGIGAAGHGNGLYLLGRQGEPLVAVQSLDTRAAGVSTELDGAAGDRLHEISRQRPWPSQTPSLLAWFKRHQPDVYARAGTLQFAKDVLTAHLTGRRVSDISDMSGAGLLRLPEAIYDRELLALYGLADAETLLPDIRLPTDVVGAVTRDAAMATGLAEGTPVVAGYFDVVASALGSGAVQAGTASIVAGSWSINQVLSDTAAQDAHVLMVAAYGPGRFVNMDNSATSAVNVEWYVRNLIERSGHQGDAFAVVNAAIADIRPAPDDPLFHPFLYGGRRGAHQRSGFYGLSGWHAEGHLLRAVLEGVMFEHRRHIGVLQAAGMSFSRVILSGGGARSPHWPQMFADGLGVPVIISESSEPGALGGAIAAAVGVGVYSDEVEAARRMTRPARTFAPTADMKPFYDRRYALWLQLIDAVDPIWRQLVAGAQTQ